MFTTSPFYWQMEKAYAEKKDIFSEEADMEAEKALEKDRQLAFHDELRDV